MQSCRRSPLLSIREHCQEIRNLDEVFATDYAFYRVDDWDNLQID